LQDLERGAPPAVERLEEYAGVDRDNHSIMIAHMLAKSKLPPFSRHYALPFGDVAAAR
jgi:hypothetical protein